VFEESLICKYWTWNQIRKETQYFITRKILLDLLLYINWSLNSLSSEKATCYCIACGFKSPSTKVNLKIPKSSRSRDEWNGDTLSKYFHYRSIVAGSVATTEHFECLKVTKQLLVSCYSIIQKVCYILGIIYWVAFISCVTFVGFFIDILRSHRWTMER